MVAGWVAVDELLLTTPNDLLKAFNDVVDLIDGQSHFKSWSGDTRWVVVPGRSPIRVLRRLRSCGHSRRGWGCLGTT